MIIICYSFLLCIHFQAVQGQREEPCGEGCVVGGVCGQEWNGGREVAQAQNFRGALVHLPPPGSPTHLGHYYWSDSNNCCESLQMLC